MTTNPFYNAVLASAYIVGLVSLIFGAPSIIGEPEENILLPMGMLSLLVLSVALMAYLFFYRPVVMLLDGEREKAAKLFLQTVGIFAGLTLALLALITVIR